MKIYKEYVILGVALLGAVIVGATYLMNQSDNQPTVDQIIPTPLDISTPESSEPEERTDDTESSEGVPDALPS
jgi:hypothetical protein